MGCHQSRGGDPSNAGHERLYLASEDPDRKEREHALQTIRDSFGYAPNGAHPGVAPSSMKATSLAVKAEVMMRPDVIKELFTLSMVGVTMKEDEFETTLAKYNTDVQGFLTHLRRKNDEAEGGITAEAIAKLPLEERLAALYKPSLYGTRSTSEGRPTTWWSAIPFEGATLNDAAFAYTHMNSGASEFLQQVQAAEMPEHFGITQADVAHVLPSSGDGEATTLAALLAAGRLYACDFSALLADVMDGKKEMIDAGIRAAPIALFWATGAVGTAATADSTTTTTLLPLAIRLFPKVAGREADPVFTPGGAHGEPAWSAAKLYVNNAAIACHTSCLHAFAVEIMGTISNALMRNVSDKHPLQGFMAPFVNQFWAFELQYAAMGYKVDPDWTEPIKARWTPTFRLSELNFKERVTTTHATAKLPQCLVAHDTLRLWAVYEAFVRGAVEAVYADDAAVAADAEIQAWGKEMVSAEGCNIRGTPVDATGGAFETRQQLIDTILPFVYFLSAGHGFDVANWPWYAWIPAEPLHFKLDPPRTMEAATAITDDDVVAALDAPFSSDALFQVCGLLAASEHRTFSRLFTGGPDGRSVPATPHYMQNYPGFHEVGKKWHAALDATERCVAARNKAIAEGNPSPAGAGWPMEGLQPTYVCLSLWE